MSHRETTRLVREGNYRRDPWGDLAAAVTRLIDAYPRYGTSPLWRAWIDRCRARAQAPAEACTSQLTESHLRA